MSELKALEEKMVSLFGEVNKRFDGIDRRFDEVDKRFEGIDKRFDDVDTELKMIRFEMQSESSRLQESIANLDNRVSNLEILATEKWNVPELKDRMDTVEHVVSKHSEQIRALNEKVGIAAG